MKLIKCLALASLSTTAFAGGQSSQHFWMAGAGVGYSHTYYKSNAVPPETRGPAPLSTAGQTINPGNVYPNNFWGGFANLSYYMNSWLINTQYNLYTRKTKNSGTGATANRVKFAPARFTFSVDKVFGNVFDTSYGLGLGVVHETINDGESLRGTPAGAAGGLSIDNDHLDPMAEVFVMKNFGNNLLAKLNVAYQFNPYSRYTNGDLNANLGINYIFSM